MKIKISEIVAVDVETTGLDPEKDRICEIALLQIKNWRIVDKFTTLINPEIKIPPYISSLSGITDTDVKEAPLFKEIVDKIHKIIKGNTLLFHNASFDIGFLKKEFERCGIEFPEVKIIDTYLIAKNFFNFRSNSLSYISRYFKLERVFQHRAEDDAKAAFKIFELFCKKIDKKYSFTYKNLADLYFYRHFKNKFFQKILLDTKKIESKILLNKELFEKIKEALEKKEKIMIRYINREKGITEREILPLEIIEEKSAKYLKAFCFKRNEERIFKFDRIIEIVENIK